MASSINASTSSGIVQTADTSGILNLQSNGTTKVAVSSSGVDLTGLSKSSLPTGSVLQVVNASYSTQSNTTSTSFIDTGLTASITPISATSKILVFVSQSGIYKAAANNYIKLQLLRGATVIVNFENEILNTGTATVNSGATSTTYLDSPATISATTYKTQIAMGGAGVGPVYWCTSNCSATITLMEIAA